MLVLIVFIICSAMFYLYYKAKNVRTNRPVEKKFWSAKSSMALGCFVLLFGVNQLFLNRSSLAFVIGFVLLQLVSAVHGPDIKPISTIFRSF